MFLILRVKATDSQNDNQETGSSSNLVKTVCLIRAREVKVFKKLLRIKSRVSGGLAGRYLKADEPQKGQSISELYV
jgi:hypothetical protein